MRVYQLVSILSSLAGVQSFAPSFTPHSQTQTRSSTSFLKSSPETAPQETAEEEEQRQWDLFRKHHARGSWKGIWTTYDYIGDVMDETVASVNYYSDEDGDIVEQTHSIVTGAKRSDCATCFDSMEQKEFPVKLYDRNNKEPPVFQKTRFAANAMVNGPSLLKSGVMATELILSWGDGRVRVIFSHAPVWAAGVEPGSGPPQGLKLLRTMVSKETMRPTAPTYETETANPPTEGNPTFYRPVPPFNWHKKWAGTSWTWGPSAGDRGWAIEDLEEEDSWQGISTVERWNLRLPGGIFMQAPRVVTDMNAELCRLAWLPDDETLLRVEAGCLALQPMVLEDDSLVGFYPPSLSSLRCDVLKKMGEPDRVPMFVTDGNADELEKPQTEEEVKKAPAESVVPPPAEAPKQQEAVAAAEETKSSESPKAKTTTKPKSDDDDSGLQAVRDALSL